NVLYNAIGSQNFTSGTYAQYSDQGADDFVVPGSGVKKWVIKEVDVPGVNYGSHQATSMNVIFYNDAGGLPGSVAAECDNQSSNGYNGSGGYAIKLKGKTCAIPAKLKPG